MTTRALPDGASPAARAHRGAAAAADRDTSAGADHDSDAAGGASHGRSAAGWDPVLAGIQRGLLTVGLVVSAVWFWRESLDVFNTVKATVVVMTAVGVAGLAVLRALLGTRRVGRVHRPDRARVVVAVAVAAFVVALVVATVTSPVPMLSIVGKAGRHTGLALYAAHVALFVAAARLYRNRSPAPLLLSLVAAAVPVIGYGLVQAAGVDPLAWRTVEGGPPVFSTFGNTNFFSAWVGIVAPLAVCAALNRRLPTAVRTAAAAVAGVGLVTMWRSGSMQGPVVALVGAGFVLLVWLWTVEGLSRRIRVAATAGAGTAAFIVVGAVAAGLGPLGEVRDGLVRSLQTRVGKWEAALGIISDHPWTGVGLDRYGDWYHRYRSADVALESGLRRTADTSHNVLLDLGAGGGLPLGLAWLAVMAVVAWALVRGMRHTSGDARMLLAGVGGGWLAYVGQTTVSMDVPPLAALGWVMAGLTVALGLGPQRRADLATARGLRSAHPPVGPATAVIGPAAAVIGPAAAVAGTCLVAIACAGAVALVARPLQADLLAGHASRLAARDALQAAAEQYRRAAALAPWEPQYPQLRGVALQQAGRPQEALVAFREALRREPRGLLQALTLARAASATDRQRLADRAYRRAVGLDPTTPEVLAEAGRRHLERGRPGPARRLLARAVRLRDDQAAWWAALGQAQLATGASERAVVSFEEALALDAGVPLARQGLNLAERRAGGSGR